MKRLQLWSPCAGLAVLVVVVLAWRLSSPAPPQPAPPPANDAGGLVARVAPLSLRCVVFSPTCVYVLGEGRDFTSFDSLPSAGSPGERWRGVVCCMSFPPERVADTDGVWAGPWSLCGDPELVQRVAKALR